MSNWGGKRKGAGSGGARPGAGRPRTKWNTRGRGAAWVMERQRPGSTEVVIEMWRILSISEEEIEFQDTKTEAIIVLRLPDNE